MNFARWLDIASTKQSARLDNDARIIIILDGPENFSDSETGKEESVDWVPWTFPDEVRFIICTRKNSKAMNHFILRKYPILYLDKFAQSNKE